MSAITHFADQTNVATTEWLQFWTKLGIMLEVLWSCDWCLASSAQPDYHSLRNLRAVNLPHSNNIFNTKRPTRSSRDPERVMS